MLNLQCVSSFDICLKPRIPDDASCGATVSVPAGFKQIHCYFAFALELKIKVIVATR